MPASGDQHREDHQPQLKAVALRRRCMLRMREERGQKITEQVGMGNDRAGYPDHSDE